MKFIEEWDKDTDIKIKRPVHFNNKTIFPLFDKNNNELFIKTPIMYLPIEPKRFNDILLEYIDIVEFNSTQFTEYFIRLLNTVVTRIHSFDKNTKNREYNTHIIQPDISTYDVPYVSETDINIYRIIRINNIHTSQSYVFSKTGEKLTMKLLIPESKVKMIIHIPYFWTTHTHYGFKIVLIQTLLIDEIYTHSLFNNIPLPPPLPPSLPPSLPHSLHPSLPTTNNTKRDITTKPIISSKDILLDELKERLKKMKINN